MLRKIRPGACHIALALLTVAGSSVVALPDDDGAPDLVAPTTDEATNEHFTTAATCALCHTTSSRSTALRTEDGRDVSPDHTWRGTLMANSFRDPYWRAKVEHEIAHVPEAARAAIEALCLGCHGPMASRSATMLESAMPSVAAAAGDPLAADGVSCTICHQIEADGLGEERSYTARFVIGAGRKAFGPYAEPFARPMRHHSGFEATHGPHVSRSALCATCHTVITRAGDDAPWFLEQAPYLEWRNSAFSDEDGRTPTSRTCQECHMPDEGTLRIAHNPGGRDFGRVGPREHVRSHAIAGGNAFMIELLDTHWEELGVVTTPEQSGAALAATRGTLADAAALTVGEPLVDGGRAVFDVRVENRTGHKLPTSYPARRVWLRVQVSAGDAVVFDSGRFDARGRIAGPADEARVPHADRIDDDSEVVIYEMRAVDGDGAPTFVLHTMEGLEKDTRLLPRGWSPDGPDADRTRPVGTGGDDDFTAGADTVTYDVALPPEAADVDVRVWLLYQAIPPAWVDPLRELETPYARAFVRMFDEADTTPEILATTAWPAAR